MCKLRIYWSLIGCARVATTDPESLDSRWAEQEGIEAEEKKAAETEKPFQRDEDVWNIPPKCEEYFEGRRHIPPQ